MNHLGETIGDIQVLQRIEDAPHVPFFIDGNARINGPVLQRLQWKSRIQESLGEKGFECTQTRLAME
jgi:hypothetical protein